MGITTGQKGVQSDMVLKVQGTNYAIFKDAWVNRSMIDPAPGFMFYMQDYYLGKSSEWKIKMGSNITVEVHGEKVLDGYVDMMNIEGDSNKGSTIEIWGREKTCDIIDCSYEGSNREWRNQTAQAIIQAICDYFDITLVVDSSVTSEANTQIKTFKPEEGTTAIDNIMRLCNPLGILPMSNGDGKLTLTRAGSTPAMTTGGIKRGTNTISHKYKLSDRARFSEYQVRGQGIGDDNNQLADWQECYGSFTDSVITRTRPKSIFADLAVDNGKCRNYAKWASWNAAGLSRVYTYSMMGWKMDNDKPWPINKTVRVTDDWYGIDETMLIIDVDFYLQNGRTKRTDVTVCNSNTFAFSSNSTNAKMKAFDV